MNNRLEILFSLLIISSIINNIFTPMISHASDFLTNISAEGINSNDLPQLPSGVTVLDYGEKYYFNLFSKSGVFPEKAVLYIYRNGELVINHSYDTERDVPYLTKTYQFTKPGNYTYYWVITKSDRQVESTERKSFTVVQNVTLLLSKSEITLTEIDQSETILARIQGKGFRDITYTCSQSGIVSGVWGKWNGSERVFTVRPLRAGETTVAMTVRDFNGNPISFASALLHITVKPSGQSLSGTDKPSDQSLSGKNKPKAKKSAVSRKKNGSIKIVIKKVGIIKGRIRGKSTPGAGIKLICRNRCIRKTKVRKNGTFYLKKIALHKYRRRQFIIKATKKGYKSNVFRFHLKYIH